MDKVFIKNLKVIGILGIHPHEQRSPREILVSLEVTTDIHNAAQNDNILQSVNYSTLAEKIDAFITDSHFFTIEALIEALANAILEDALISSVWLRIEKPYAVPKAESVGVEITRFRTA